MFVTVFVARLALAAVFGVAGVAKMFDRAALRRAISDFGAPTTLIGVGSLLLPWVEVAVAILLLVPATSWWGGLASLILLAGFTVAVVGALGRGRTPDCRCFGQLAAAPIGSRTVVRNAVFAVPAVIIVLFG
jgi:hypothetical protein